MTSAFVSLRASSAAPAGSRHVKVLWNINPTIDVQTSADLTMEGSDTGRLTVYTTTRCSGCTMAKAVLDRAGIDFEEIDIDRDADAAATVLAINGGYRSVPTILLPDGRVLVEPSRRDLLAALGLENLPEAS
jgi:mycoredoxin